MGSFQAVKPLVGEEGVGPALMVVTSATAGQLHPLAEDAPQTHAYPAVDPLKRPLVAVLEIFKPAPQGGIERPDDHEKALSGVPRGLRPDRFFELVQALRSGTAAAALEPITEKVKGIGPCVD